MRVAVLNLIRLEVEGGSVDFLGRLQGHRTRDHRDNYDLAFRHHHGLRILRTRLFV